MHHLLEGRIEEPANLRFANHLRRHQKELFTYLDVEAVSPTNNEGERETRPGVIVRKIQGGNRTPDGAHDHERRIPGATYACTPSPSLSLWERALIAPARFG